jgi:ankyrin repeat protein
MTMEKVTCQSMDLKFTTAVAKASRNIPPCLPFESPVDFLRVIILQDKQVSACCNDNKTRKHFPSEEEMNGYTMEAVRAIRDNDVAKLREMLNNGGSLEACNSNGEYLIHLAARRANMETVRYLVEHANVDVNVRDNMGRTIFHDVCWKSSPDTALMDVLLQVISPELLLAKDQRGHTPFD